MTPAPPSTGPESTLAATPHAPDRSAETLLPQVYDELRRLAQRRLLDLPPGQTLQATALVHEAYVRIAGRDDAKFEGRTVFFIAAARAMRDVVVEHVRQRHRLKRGGDRQRIDLEKIEIAAESDAPDILALDELLTRLEQQDRRLSELVTLRYFAGVTMEEAADALGISLATANREWRYAKAWLHSELTRHETQAEQRNRS